MKDWFISKKEREQMYDRMKEERRVWEKKIEGKESRKTAKTTPRGKKRCDSDDDDEDEDDYKAELRKKKPRVQKARSPIKPGEWKSWERSADEAKTLRARWGPGFPKVADMKGEGILEVAEMIAKASKKPSKEELADGYKKENGSKGPERSSRVDLIVGVMAEICQKPR